MEHPIEREGCRIVYQVHGSGPPVLLIQGVGVHGDGWRPQVEALSDRFTCITLDNRGLGKSQPAGDVLSVGQMAGDCLAVLDDQRIETAHVVGHSLGGLIALELALRARSRVRSLALLCTFASGKAAAPLGLRMVWLGMRARIGPRHMRRAGFLQLIMPRAALARTNTAQLAADLAPLFGHDLAEQPPIVSRQLRAMRAYSADARLKELAGLPTLVVSAAHDPIAPPAAGRALAAGIPGAVHLELADASHGAPIALAEQVNNLIEDHWTRAPHGRGT